MEFRIATADKQYFDDIIERYPWLYNYGVHKDKNNLMYTNQICDLEDVISLIDRLKGTLGIVIQDETGDTINGIELKGYCIIIYDGFLE